MTLANTNPASMGAAEVKPMRIGIIGVGNIAPAYIEGCRAFDVLDLVACADLNEERARQIAAEHNIPRATSVDAMLADPDIDIVVNLTIPAAHAEVSIRALNAGKHVYTEKPLAITLDTAREVMQTAEARGLRVGCAPDTFLFAPHQTARKAIDDGVIGEPVAAVGFMMGHGPEGWHPNPDFFYAQGAGPMFDMGPYYVTCLVNLLGAVVRVSGAARASFPERIGKAGRRIPVTVPTHYAGTLEFESGAIATLITSFDVWAHRLPQMEIYGSSGSLTIPDPNGHLPKAVEVRLADDEAWREIPLAYEDRWARGIGLADMATAIRTGRAHRVTGALALHAVEVMSAFERATTTGTYIDIESRVDRPAPLPLDLPTRMVDA